ncbi:MAG: hypothetical protein JXR51_06310 [Bacteroidales bacterium]|nr:hypothetical protein [Bacteroidales bacterium]MBN2756774.1 hypothetical protein [Bacteroidales bacterium]
MQDFETEIELTQLIKLSENDTDTITFKIERAHGGTVATKNGRVVAEMDKPS